MIFTQVYPPATGTSARGPWTRHDYKTADGTRYALFADTAEIPLNVDVALELTPKGAIKSWKATGASAPAGNPQAAQESQNGSRGPTFDYTANQRDFKAEAEGKTRCALVSTLLPAMFTALSEEDQNRESAEVLLDWAFGYVFQTDAVPF